jgi:hypothetical protein
VLAKRCKSEIRYLLSAVGKVIALGRICCLMIEPAVLPIALTVRRLLMMCEALGRGIEGSKDELEYELDKVDKVVAVVLGSDVVVLV